MTYKKRKKLVGPQLCSREVFEEGAYLKILKGLATLVEINEKIHMLMANNDLQDVKESFTNKMKEQLLEKYRIS